MTSNKKNPIAGFHLIRYGTAADQKFLLPPFLATYDQLVVNANIVAHMPSALGSFIAQQSKNKPYLIDPQTHAFQHDIEYLKSTSNSEPKIKRSIEKLTKAYGEPVEKSVLAEGRPVLPEDFNKTSILRNFCKHVIEFQLNAISNEVSKSDVKKYYEFLKKKKPSASVSNFGPSLVVAPYFYMRANTLESWLKVNLACAVSSQAIAKKNNVPLAVQIVISQDVLTDKNLLQKLVRSYAESVKPCAYLLWVDSFSEHQASESQLHSYVDLLERLAANAPVVVLYGGFFTVALKRCGLIENIAGVTHSLEYGEDRAVVPVGGGVPVAKFYFPALHARLPFRDAVRAVRAFGGLKGRQHFFDNVCDCEECKLIIKNDPESDFAVYGQSKPFSFRRGSQTVVMEYPLTETKAHTLRHYLWSKEKEYRSAISLKSTLQSLENAAKTARASLGLESTAHCEVWQRVLEAKSSPNNRQ